MLICTRESNLVLVTVEYVFRSRFTVQEALQPPLSSFVLWLKELTLKRRSLFGARAWLLSSIRSAIISYVHYSIELAGYAKSLKASPNDKGSNIAMPPTPLWNRYHHKLYIESLVYSCKTSRWWHTVQISRFVERTFSRARIHIADYTWSSP